MNFSSNGIGRKNGYRFEVRFGQWLDGIAQDNKYYLYCSRPIAGNLYHEGFYTERSLRFPTSADAEAFCEKIASGEVNINELRVAEKQAEIDYETKKFGEAGKAVDAFLEKMETLGVNPALAPEITQAYLSMNQSYEGRCTKIFNERIAEMEAMSPKASVSKISLKEYMDLNQQDIDLCIVDRDTGEHYMPAICYLLREEVASGNYEYDDWEKWALSLPLSHISHSFGYPMAVVHTDYSCDEVSFLLDEDNYETRKWENLDRRAYWAGADFNARLSFLEENLSFETPFDVTCMDAADPNKRKDICKMITDNTHVYVTSYPHNETEFYVYCLKQDPFDDTLWYDVEGNDIPIIFTEPGKGLASTLDGKIHLAEYMSNKYRTEVTEKISIKHNEAVKGGPEL